MADASLQRLRERKRRLQREQRDFDRVGDVQVAKQAELEKVMHIMCHNAPYDAVN